MALPVCTIDENGIFKPDYATVKAYVESLFRDIYGPDVYIEPDSQDGQLLAIFASAMDDANAQTVQAYNNYSPSSARGSGLSIAVKINGLTRKVATHSTVDLRIIGQAGTTISGGIAQGLQGDQWILPPIVVIPPSGEVTVTGTAREKGDIRAAPGEVSQIGTPTRGWQSVTNLSEAVPGAAVETDAELRQRQAVSTALPSRTVFEGTVGAVASLPGVTRYRGYENDGSVTDSNGLPPHSISLVVDGGDAQAIAQAIADKKTPGTGTYGTTSVDIVDEYGVTRAIRFYRPTAATIKVVLSVVAMTGYTTAIETAIKQTIVDWVNSLQIGEDVEYAEMYVPANLNGDPDRRTYRITAMTIAKDAGPPGTSDLIVAFNEAAESSLADVTVVVAP